MYVISILHPQFAMCIGPNYILHRLLTTMHVTVWLSPYSPCKLLYCQKLFTVLFNLQCGFEQRVCMATVCLL